MASGKYKIAGYEKRSFQKAERCGQASVKLLHDVGMGIKGSSSRLTICIGGVYGVLRAA